MCYICEMTQISDATAHLWASVCQMSAFTAQIPFVYLYNFTRVTVLFDIFQVAPVKASFVEYIVQECPEGVTERGTCQRLTLESDTEVLSTGKISINNRLHIFGHVEMFPQRAKKALPGGALLIKENYFCIDNLTLL